MTVPRAKVLPLVLVTLGAWCPSQLAQPPETVPEIRAPTPVNASFAKSWNAVIDIFANQSIPIRTIDRSSGLIVTDQLYVSQNDAIAWADCGTDPSGEKVAPAHATYNVVVRGDSARSSVRTTVRFADRYSATGTLVAYDCVSRGVWETGMEATIRDMAEGHPVTAIAPRPTKPADPCAGAEHRVVHGHDECWVQEGGTWIWKPASRKP